MSTSKKKSSASHLLEKACGGPLTLGSFLESIRLSEEKSQAEFARALGISRMYLCDVEKGRRGVSPGRASEFAKILGYSSTQFIRLAFQDLANREGLSVRVEIQLA